MSRRLPLLLALLGVTMIVVAVVLLLAPLPEGGAEGSALSPEYPDVALTGGLTTLSDEQYEQVYGRENVVGQRRGLATTSGLAGVVLLVVSPVVRRQRSRNVG